MPEPRRVLELHAHLHPQIGQSLLELDEVFGELGMCSEEGSGAVSFRTLSSRHMPNCSPTDCWLGTGATIGTILPI